MSKSREKNALKNATEANTELRSQVKYLRAALNQERSKHQHTRVQHERLLDRLRDAGVSEELRFGENVTTKKEKE